LAQKESETVEILSRYLAQIITHSAAHDHAALEHSLQSIISPAIAQEIADNKEKMIDALYPIMGGMISKYVTQAIKEMMEKINEKIEQGLSVERYKRKVKAKLTGVSETELLLEESSDADIQAIFVIQKETGLLIAEAHLENSEIDDPHMVASMASAIKDFVNDWITSQEETDSKEVQLLSYGDATLYIESAGSVYLIAFLDAEPDYEQRGKINAFFSRLLKKQSRFFQDFDGDDSAPEIKEIEAMIQAFLNAEDHQSAKTPKSEKKNPAKLIFLLLGIGAAVWGGYLAKGVYERYLLEKEISQKVGEKISIEEKDGILYLHGHLSSMEDFSLVDRLLKEHTKKRVVNEIYLSPAVLDEKLKAQQQEAKALRQKVERLSHTHESDLREEKKLASEIILIKKDLEALRTELKHTDEKLRTLTAGASQAQAKLSTLEEIAHVRQRALERLRKKFGDNPDFQPADGSLDFKSGHLFEAGGSIPIEDALERVSEEISSYIRSLMEDPRIRPYIKKFVIEGYTDSSGTHTLNMKLSRERAEAIKRDLLTLPLAEKYALDQKLDAKGRGESHPILVNGEEDKEASRRIKIRFELDREKILDAIGQNISK
jgi:outer membrane protein OmpA-like peptidoglycan-associated protein